MPDQLPQFPGRRRGDPRLGQPSHPQQVSEVSGVAFVVLDPAVGKSLDTQWVGQVDPRARLGQHVHRPVPAVRGLHHHLRALAPASNLLGQGERVVVDACLTQPLALRRQLHDHRTSPVQIDTNDLPTAVLCVHTGPRPF